MRFESQWAGDAIAAPICSTYDREDAFFESRDDRPTNLSGWRSWIGSIASIVAQLWSAMLRERELPPYEFGLGKGRRPNAEGHRSFPLRDRVWE